jgi:hypothetical protein
MLSVAVRQQFELQKSEVVNNVAKWPLTKSYKAKGTKQDKKEKLDELIAWVLANLTLSDAMQPILYSLMVETGMDAAQQIGMDPSQFNPLDPAIIKSARMQADKAAGTINQETDKQLRATLSEGLDAEDSIDELFSRIENVFGSALTLRTARIAAAESYRAMGNADVAVWIASGQVTGKEWYTAKDERVCPWCSQLDGTIIEITGDFYKLGDTVEAASRVLNIAYDNIAAPPLHISCRCVILDVDLA